MSAVRREPAGGAWTAKWAKDSLNRAVDITRSGSLPVTLSRARARPPPRAFAFNAKDDARPYRMEFNENIMAVFFQGKVGPRVAVKP